MKNVVFFAFLGEPMCFNHLLFNAVDMHEKGINTHIVVEGQATKLLPDLIKSDNPLFKKVRELKLIDAVCKACARQTGVLEYLENETNLPINDDLLGHPPMAPYIQEGYQIITL